MRKTFYFLLISIFGWNCNQKTGTTREETLSRNDISEAYKWDLSPLCADSASWVNDYKIVETGIEKFVGPVLKITNAQDLFKVLYEKDSLYNELLRLYLYAMMQEHIDLNNEQAQSMRMQMDILESKFYDVFSVIEPSVLKLDTITVKGWMEGYPELKQYDFYLKDLFQKQEHIPTEEQSQILNHYLLASESVRGIYDELFYSDLKEPDYDRYNPNRDERISSYKKHTDFYASKRNTVSAIIVTDLQLKFAYANSIGYNSLLQEDLNNDKVPVSIYHALSSEMKSGAKALQKYHKLRAKYLKINNYQPADRKFSTFSSQAKYNYDTARTIIKKALEPLGNTYQEYLKQMLNNNKIDVFDNDGKLSSVAYSVSMFGKTPYILTSYENNLKDIFDLIHELGHAVHAIYSMNNQALSKYQPSILKDEITSAFNELLLIDFLLKNADDTRQKLHILETAINNMEYYFSESMNTDFTYSVCTAIESDEAVTASNLDTLYLKTYKDYYGNSITNINPSSWTMYGMLDYYNYKYVISMTASLMFYESIKNGGEQRIERYIDFLKMGGNDYPLEQLKKAGIDLNNENVLASIGVYTDRLVDMYEKELNKYTENE